MEHKDERFSPFFPGDELRVSYTPFGAKYKTSNTTFYDQKEINNRDMSEIPHPFVIESMKLFDDLEIKHKNKIYFIHLNHTNPLLNSNSKEYKYVVSNGYNVAKEGLELKL